VFCTEDLAKHLKEKFDILIEVNHTQLVQKGIK
jgi:hypothetical protein